jgi:hypothetical protein
MVVVTTEGTTQRYYPNFLTALGLSRQYRRPRPKCEATIKRLGLRPVIRNGTWDSHGWTDGTVEHCSGLSQNMRTEMRRLVEIGYFGPVAIKR